MPSSWVQGVKQGDLVTDRFREILVALMVIGEVPTSDDSTIFDVVEAFVESSVQVFVDGVALQRGVGFTETGANQITLAAPLGEGAAIWVNYLKSGVAVAENIVFDGENIIFDGEEVVWGG